MSKRCWTAAELVPGVRVTWRQFSNDSLPEFRTGVVWCRGPNVDGTRAVAWVRPDLPRDYDLYALIAVGIASRRHVPAGTDRVGDNATTGELFSCSVGSSPLGGLTEFAMKQAHKARQLNAMAVAR
jgi:hypothetical protein